MKRQVRPGCKVRFSPFRIRLRTLMLIVFAMAVPLACMSYLIKQENIRVRRKSDTAATLTSLGATVGYTSRPAVNYFPSWAVRFVWQSLGDERGLAHLCSITTVDLSNKTSITDSSIGIVANLHDLRDLDITGTSITDAGIET